MQDRMNKLAAAYKRDYKALKFAVKLWTKIAISFMFIYAVGLGYTIF